MDGQQWDQSELGDLAQTTLLTIDPMQGGVSGPGNVNLPEGEDFLRADFTRAGPDLMIETPSGTTFVVADYFMAEAPAPLTTADGQVLTGTMVSALAGPAAPGQSVQIAVDGVDTGTAQPGIAPGASIGQVSEVEGAVNATRADGTQVTLATGDPIYQGDVIETGGGANVAVVFVDDTIFTLDEDGRMVMDEMVYDPGTQTGTFNAEVVQGVFSFVSGKVAKTSPDGMVVNTPTSTIGIRGSTVTGDGTTITLVRDVDGNVGEVIISNAAGSVVLNQANAATFIDSFNSAPAQPTIISQQDLQARFGASLTKLTKVVADKAQADAQRASQDAEQKEDEAQQAEAQAQQAAEEAAQAEDEAAQAEEEAQAELEQAQAEGDAEAIAEAEAKAAAAAQARAEAEAKAAAAEAAAAEAAAKAAEAQAAQEQAQQAQQFQAAAQTAFTQQTQAFEQAEQQQQQNNDPTANTADTANTTTTVVIQDSNTNSDDSNPNPDDDPLPKPEPKKPLVQQDEPLDTGENDTGDDVTPPNTAPDTVKLNMTGNEDHVISGKLDVTDPEGHTVTYAPKGGAAHGTLFVGTDGAFRYTPDADYFGTDSFVVTAKDSLGLTSESTVTLNVNPVNDAPRVTMSTVSPSKAPPGGAGLGFDGSDDYVEISEATLNNVPSGTIEAWVYVDHFDTAGLITMRQHDFHDSTAAFGIGGTTATDSATAATTSGVLSWHADNAAGTVTSTGTIQAGQWQHVAVTFTATQVKFYINGSSDTTINGDYSVPNDTVLNGYTPHATIGGQIKLGSVFNAFNGRIADLRLWEVERSAGQIGDFAHAALTGNEAGLVGYWPLSSVTNGTTADLTANGDDGVLGTATVGDGAEPTTDGLYNVHIVQGAEVTLTSTHLNATDVDNTDGALTYTITGLPTGGALKLNGTGLDTGGTFTQADVNAGNVTYAQSGSAISTDSFTFTVSDGTLGISAQTFDMLISALPSGTYTVASGETLNINADIAPTTLINNGTVNVTAGTIATPTTVANYGTLNVTGGTFSNAALSNQSGGVINYSSGSHLANAVVNDGTINVTTGGAQLGTLGFTNNGVVDIAAGVTLVGAYNYAPTFSPTSVLQGDGTFKTAVQAPYTYNAIVNPGTDGTVGAFTFHTWDANFSRTVNFSSTTVYNADIAGTATGEYDTLTLTTAHPSALDGTLSLNAINGYTPTSGDSFQVLTYASGTAGRFTINHDFGAGWNVLASYNATDLTLTVLDDAAATTDTAGNDTLLSLAGNDTITNDAGGADVFNLNGAMADYTMSFASDGTLTLTDTVGSDGADTLKGIETLSFTDSDITLTQEAPERQVNTTTANDRSYPKIIGLDDGGHIIVWDSFNGTDWDVVGQRYDAAGQAVGGEFAIASGAGDQFFQQYTQLQSFSDGGYAVTWLGGDSADYTTLDAMATIYDETGTAVAGNITVSATTTNQQGPTSVTKLNNGDFVFVWQSRGQWDSQNEPNAFDVYARRFQSDGTPIDGSDVLINTTTTGNQYMPAVTALDTGGYAVVWRDDSSGTPDIKARFFDEQGAEAVAEFSVASTATSGTHPKVSTLDDGNIVVTWSSHNGTDHDVYAKVIDANGTAVTGDVLVSLDTANEQSTTHQAALENGGFVVAWCESDGAQFDILAQTFDANGNKVGGEIAVNTDITANGQLYPSVTATYDGGFIVTWQSQDAGLGLDVYSKRFDENGNELGYTTLTGDATNNTFNIQPSDNLVAIDGAGGTDTIGFGGASGETNMVKATNVETFTGAAADDIVLMGGALAGTESIDLGAGTDTIKLADGGNADTTFTNVEEVIGGTGNDTVTIATTFAAADNAWFDGMGGTDVLNLTAGNDVFDAENFETINGGAGIDNLSSEWGVDLVGVTINGLETITIDNNNDGQERLLLGNDYAFAAPIDIVGSGDDMIEAGNSLDLSLASITGISEIQIDQDGTNTVGATLTLGNGNLQTNTPMTFTGTGDDIVIVAANATVDLTNPTFNGITELRGHNGSETVVSQDGMDLQNITAITDLETIQIDADNNAASTLWVDSNTSFGLATNGNAMTIQGTGGNDSIKSNWGMDLSNVQTTGIDTITVDDVGGSGPQVLTLGAHAYNANAIVGDGDDIIQMSANTLDLSTVGSVTGIASINGTAAADSITGTAGDDVIIGSSSGDTLTGGGGTDIFRYTTPTESYALAGSVDSITDFTAGAGGDVLDVGATGTVQVIASQAAGTDSTTLTQDWTTLNTLANSTNGTLTTVLTGDTANTEAMELTTTDSKTLWAIDNDASGTFDNNDLLIDVTGLTNTIDAGNIV